jgi:hypothetical protein
MLLKAIIFTLLFCGVVSAEVRYRDARKRIIELKGCAIFPGVSSVVVGLRGSALAILPRSLDREAVRLPQSYRYFGCTKDLSGKSVVFAKERVGSAEVPLTLDDATFPLKGDPQPEEEGEENSGKSTTLNAKCQKVEKFPGSFIYKTIGSNHFSDIRRNTIGLIVKPGLRANWPRCVDVLDKEGNRVALLSLYAVGGKWSARFYAGVGCATGTPFNGSRVSSLARAESGDNEIYFDFGNTCFGPVRADRCVGSSSC